jgi:prevent-host-death family protein
VAEAAFNVHEAKTHLSRLLQQVSDGDEIVIAKAGKPVARLVPFDAARTEDRKLGELGRTRPSEMRFSHDAASADISTIQDIDAIENADTMENTGPISTVGETAELRRFSDAG